MRPPAASAPPLTRAALALYPPSWRARYGDEVRALLEDSGGSPAAVASVAWRALPAWFRPPRHLHDRPARMRASLADEPKHGYAITQDVAETMGVRLSAGTLYAVISRLEARGLIEPLESDDRRRPYRITTAGAEALAEQSERMSQVASVARERLSTRLGWAGA